MPLKEPRFGSRAEAAAAVAALHKRGLNGIAISRELGICRSYAYELINDPEGIEVRKRKDSYRGVCEDCGAPTDGSNGPNAPARCFDCIRWTRDQAIAAVEDFFAEHSRSPLIRDANVGGLGHGALPTSGTVDRLFGTWNRMLLEVGLPLTMDRRPETQEEIERLLREGHSASEIAEMYGWTPANIHERLKTRGLKVTDIDPHYFDRHGTFFKPRHPEHVKRRAVQLYAEGMSSHQVAAAIGNGIAFTTVIRWARKAGVPIRPRTGWDYERQAA